MTTTKEIIKNIKASLKENFKITKADIKLIRHDVISIHLPIPDKVKPFPHSVEDNPFVPVSFGPDGIDMTVRLSSFEKEYGLMSDYAAANLALNGLIANHKDEISEVHSSVLREYITEDYIRSYICFSITLMRDAEFKIDPWLHIHSSEGNNLVVSVDADIVFDVYRELAEDGVEDLLKP